MSDIEDSKDCMHLLPKASQKRYEDTYKLFKSWCQDEGVNTITENVMLAYFAKRSEKLKSPGSLWCEYSMLKSTIFINENKKISQFAKLRAFLKRKNHGFKPKKSRIFTREDMNKFLLEAPDNTYLLMKVVMIMGIAGACKKDELCKMLTEDVEDKNSVIIITIPYSKKQRSFTIINQDEQRINFVEIVRKYIDARQNKDNRRFFIKYHAGKCMNQPVGKNTFSKIPAQIAEYLGLENPSTYTCHSFRRTAATFLADTGIQVLGLKRLCGWKSSAVAESYVSDSMRNKIDVADTVLYKQETLGELDSDSSSTMQSIGNPTAEEQQEFVGLNDIEINENISLDSIKKKCNSIVQASNCSNCSFVFNISK